MIDKQQDAQQTTQDRTVKRRQAPRIRIEALVDIGDDTTVFAEAVNLSERGICVTAAEPLLEHNRLKIRLEVPRHDGTRECCVLDGEVVRRDDRQLAISFDTLKAGQYLRLRDYVWRASRSGFGIERRTAIS